MFETRNFLYVKMQINFDWYEDGISHDSYQSLRLNIQREGSMQAMYILTFKFANWNGKKSELVLINRLRFLKLSERGIHLKIKQIYIFKLQFLKLMVSFLLVI
jgi:hypothetical protein